MLSRFQNSIGHESIVTLKIGFEKGEFGGHIICTSKDNMYPHASPFKLHKFAAYVTHARWWFERWGKFTGGTSLMSPADGCNVHDWPAFSQPARTSPSLRTCCAHYRCILYTIPNTIISTVSIKLVHFLMVYTCHQPVWRRSLFRNGQYCWHIAYSVITCDTFAQFWHYQDKNGEVVRSILTSCDFH